MDREWPSVCRSGERRAKLEGSRSKLEARLDMRETLDMREALLLLPASLRCHDKMHTLRVMDPGLVGKDNGMCGKRGCTTLLCT